MRSSTGILRAAWIVTLMGWTHGYPDMAGSCEGVFSGAHIAIRDLGKKRSTGGWNFEVDTFSSSIQCHLSTCVVFLCVKA